MKVCHMCDGSVAGDYFRNITAGLTKNGIDVLLVEIAPGKSPDWLIDFPQAEYISLRVAGKKGYLLGVPKLARLIKAKQVDILHTHLFYAGLMGVLAKKFVPKLKVALMRHHTSVVRMLGSRFHAYADRWMAERADHVMTVSAAAKRYMIEIDGIKRNDIKIVYLGFDFEQLSPNQIIRARARDEFGFSDDDVVIGYVGNFADGKGHLQLITAFAEIIKVAPNAKLLLLGRGMRAEVQAAAANAPSGTIIFAGWRDDVAKCYNAMDMFIQPSLSEAFSQVLIEAMGCGLPVIATDVGGANEVIENGVSGLLIEAGDPKAIYHAALRLLKDPELRERIAQTGMRHVRQRFTADSMVARHLELYDRWVRDS